MDEEEKVPVLMKEQLKKWQKPLLQVCSLQDVSCSLYIHIFLATFITCPSEAAYRFPVSGSHE